MCIFVHMCMVYVDINDVYGVICMVSGVWACMLKNL